MCCRTVFNWIKKKRVEYHKYLSKNSPTNIANNDLNIVKLLYIYISLRVYLIEKIFEKFYP